MWVENWLRPPGWEGCGPVPRGVTQGLIPGPRMCNIFINNWKMRWIAPLASLQVELWGVAGALGDKAVILRDLNGLQKWASGHTTEFNKTKREDRFMTGERTALLGKTRASWTQISDLCTLAVVKITNNTLCYVSTSKTSRSSEVIFSLYLALPRLSGVVCPILDFPERLTLTYWRGLYVFVLKTLAKSQGKKSGLTDLQGFWVTHLIINHYIVWTNLYLSQSSCKSLED